MAFGQNRKDGIKKLKLLVYNSKSEVNSFRQKIEDAFYTPFLPNHVECTEHSYGGIKCDVLSPEIYSSKRVLFYVHGGSFVGGSRRSYRGFCSLLANKSFSRVIVPEYRLAPTHAFPCAIEDVQQAFRALFTEEQIARSLANSKDKSPLSDSNSPEIIIAADGAGATIAMALVFSLREKYKNAIKNITLFSPWLNLSENSPVRTGKKMEDDVMSADCIIRSSDVYTYSSNLENQMVSPVFATKQSLEFMPEIYIQLGEKEILLKDAETFKALVEENGGKCTIEKFKNMPHLFQLADEDFFEAHDALDKFSKIVSICQPESSEEMKFENKPKLEKSLQAEA